MLRTVEAECSRSGLYGFVTVEGDSAEEVMSKDARALAIDRGSKMGMGTCGINNASGAYPVDQGGKPFNMESAEDVLRYQQQAAIRGPTVFRYRNSFKLLEAAIR